MATALATLLSLPTIPLAPEPTPIQPLNRFTAALGKRAPKLFIKRDDLLSFGLGGSKVRKIQVVAAEASSTGADTLITCGGVQSNHARVTAAAGATLGMDVVLVLNGSPPAGATGNLLLSQLFGAEVHYVRSRADRVPAMNAIADDLRSRGRRPFIVPLGASTATGAAGMARGVGELAASALRPDMIVHATSSGGTQAGLIAGCSLFGLRSRVVGISADDAACSIAETVSRLLADLAPRLGASAAAVGASDRVNVDDRFVGEGYGIPTPASTEALQLLARTEGILLDPVYTAKAMAAVIAKIADGELTADQTVLFWHTGGVPAFFA
jgi:D-cysteine desulfhydrase family pyridoxal phosphate-dependent enzyme